MKAVTAAVWVSLGSSDRWEADRLLLEGGLRTDTLLGASVSAISDSGEVWYEGCVSSSSSGQIIKFTA